MKIRPKIRPTREFLSAMISGTRDITEFVELLEEPELLEQHEDGQCFYGPAEAELRMNRMLIETRRGEIELKFYFDDICVATLGPIHHRVGNRLTIVDMDFRTKMVMT